LGLNWNAALEGLSRLGRKDYDRRRRFLLCDGSTAKQHDHHESQRELSEGHCRIV
jgi:hypothetical protein